MSRAVLRREELLAARLTLGSVVLDLAEYATTGLRIVAVGPSGTGKTNAGLVIAEQLAPQGWVCVLVDPEGEIESLYGPAVAGVDELREALGLRDRAILVVSAKDATEFIPYGEAILAAAEAHRKPIFVMVDEGQVFSAARKRKNDIGRASDLVNEFAERGRKRALDLFLTAHRFSGSLHRSIFGNKNVSLIGCQEDPTAWATLAPQFRASKLDFGDVSSLRPGEFFCFSRRGADKIRMPMADALRRVALETRISPPVVPSNYNEWDRAMCAIPTDRLDALTGPVVALLGTVAGLSSQQLLAGGRALRDELESRA